MKVPREKVIVGMPVHHFLVDAGCMNGMISCAPFYVRPIVVAGNASIALARNEIAHAFLKSDADWLMWVDADICFTPTDWQLLWEAEDDFIVCADYARKFLGLMPVAYGLGFTRVHRSVFERLATLTGEDGQDLLRRFTHKGDLMIDFHSSGALGEGRWIGEDHGFFMWAHALNITPRVVTSTRLVHAGRYGFEYPHQIPLPMLAQLLGQLSPEEQAQIAEMASAQSE